MKTAVERVLAPESAGRLRDLLGLRLKDLAVQNEAMWASVVQALAQRP